MAPLNMKQTQTINGSWWDALYYQKCHIFSPTLYSSVQWWCCTYFYQLLKPFPSMHPIDFSSLGNDRETFLVQQFHPKKRCNKTQTTSTNAKNPCMFVVPFLTWVFNLWLNIWNGMLGGWVAFESKEANPFHLYVTYIYPSPKRTLKS